ncbi:hypothetical protein [Streptomyces sp. 769]|uniref:hypothetical protein n=1 Tax=Streptomyces sp. 769 TaxID=1262452 RepID=UPI00057E6620|nr:hypothetical protein [Streptomyces sp. 769]AJC53999.1 hypothetical protein GZL_01399 [Streptomyces sp. 769]
MSTAVEKKSVATAKKAEATNEPVPVEFKDEVFLVPAPKKLSYRVLKLVESPEVGPVALVEAVLGADQAAKLERLDPTIEEFDELSGRVMEAAGFGAPEDAAGN